MTVSDIAQGRVFLISLVVGVLCVVIFDFFAVIRHRIGKNAIIVNVLDFLYLILAFLLVFTAGVKFNFGALRYYQIIGITAGIIVYYALFSKWERLVFGKLIDFTFFLTCFIIKLIYKPLMLIIRLIASVVMLMEDKIIKIIISVKKIRKKQSLKREKNKRTVKKRLKMM